MLIINIVHSFKGLNHKSDSLTAVSIDHKTDLSQGLMHICCGSGIVIVAKALIGIFCQ